MADYFVPIEHDDSTEREVPIIDLGGPASETRREALQERFGIQLRPDFRVAEQLYPISREGVDDVALIAGALDRIEQWERDHYSTGEFRCPHDREA